MYRRKAAAALGHSQLLLSCRPQRLGWLHMLLHNGLTWCLLAACRCPPSIPPFLGVIMSCAAAGVKE